MFLPFFLYLLPHTNPYIMVLLSQDGESGMCPF